MAPLNAIVGFSQSEKEANPFRIAETQSIKDEAAKIGVKQLLVTNAQSQLSKQISDIQDMLNQGAQFLIVAPLNSDGLEPALAAAAAKKGKAAWSKLEDVLAERRLQRELKDFEGD